MNIVDLQKAIGTKADGIWGDTSRKALLGAFTNAVPAASKISSAEEQAIATRLRVSVKQVRAVASVESSGGGYDRAGKPKILFERHKFHKYTGGRFSTCMFSNPSAGGYEQSSWDKLTGAAVTGAIDAAFMACSWGKFQVLGEYWDEFGFDSPFALAFSTVASEAAHYRLLADYIEQFRLQDEMAALSVDPQACRAFAKGYNGPCYEQFAYHTKLAEAMA